MYKLKDFLKISACVILLFSSCKKDEMQKKIPAEGLSNIPTEFRSWFNKRFINNQISIHGLRNTIDSAKSLNSAPKLLLEPLWAEAKNYSRGDSILAEVPLKNGNIVFSKNQIDARAFDFSKAGSLTTLLFLQTDSKVRGVLMTIIGDETYLQGDIKKLKNNTFRKKEKDFSGDILYHNSKGLFINGYRYYDGKVVGYISPGKASNSSEKKKFANATVKDVICETYKQVTTYRQCDGGCVYWSETIFFEYCYFADGVSDQGPTGCGGDGTKDLMQSVDGSACADEDPMDDYRLDYSGENIDDSDIENTSDDGPTAKIPTAITLNNGTTVMVIFGSTASDGQSANSEVSQRLIDALKAALNLVSQDILITSIYIKATTNGKHTTWSNHYRGLAVDISRINGQYIQNLGGSNNLVLNLQQAFDLVPNRRENFGPSFKRKLGQPWTIGGHDDHIHFSINGL